MMKTRRYPLYDRLRKTVEETPVVGLDLAEVASILSSSRDINEHLEIMMSLEAHHQLVTTGVGKEGFKDMKSSGVNLTLINLGEKADPLGVQIISQYFLENFQD